MKKISFQEKNNLIVRHKNGDYFDKDLDLFKKHCPGHALNNELAKANKFSYARLDGLMLGTLLDFVSIDEILENRTKEVQPDTEPRTEADIKKILVEQFDLDEKDLVALSEIIPLWLDKTDEEIISAVKKLMGEGSKDGEGYGEGDQGKTDISEIEDTYENRLVAYKQQYGEDYVLSSVEDVAIMFQFFKFPMPDSQDGIHLKLQDLVGKKFSDIPFLKPNEGKLMAASDGLNMQEVIDTKIDKTTIQAVERGNVKVFQQRIADAETIEAVETIMKEDKDGGERSTVQQAGLKRIEILKVSQDEPDGKKKDQSTKNSQE